MTAPRSQTSTGRKGTGTIFGPDGRKMCLPPAAREPLPFPRLLLTLMLLLAGIAVAAGARAAEPPVGAGSDGPLRFRRVYFPADDLKSWPGGGGVKYVPMESREFERLVTVLQSSSPGAQSQMPVRPVRAEYRAQLANPKAAGGYAAPLSSNENWDGAPPVVLPVLTGDVTLEIAPAVKTPVLVPLDPCNLAVTEAHWADAKSTPAALGLGSDGRLQVLVERSGPLRLEWSLAARRQAAEGMSYHFELPACPVNRLRLDLPEKLAPVVDRGVAMDVGPAEGGLRRWQIELGGNARVHLRLAPTGAVERRPRLVLLRQSTTYDFSPRGVEVSAQLKLDVHNEPLTEVALAIEPPLQLVSALIGDVPIASSEVSSPPNKAARLVLTLPQPLRDGTGVLRLKAMARLVAGQPWRLPRISVEGTFWQEGSMTLLVPAPLELEQIQPTGCRQSAVGALSAPRTGQSVQFDCFGPDAALNLTLAQRHPAMQLVSGVATALGDGKLTSRVTTDFRTAEASLFSLEAEVAAPWTIDSIEPFPADALDDWALEGVDGGRKLTVRLAKALGPTRPIRLVVVARRLYASPGPALGIDDLVPLRFLGSADDKRLVALRAAAAYELKLTGAERLHRVNPQSLTAAELDLFAGPPGDILFHDDLGAAGLEVSSQDRKPTYTAVVRVEAGVAGDTLLESYAFTCTPSRSAQVDRLLVHFSRRRAAPLRWSLGGEDEARLSARERPPSPQQPAGAPPAAGETWELTFRHPRSAPFEIRAAREVKLAAREPVSLASLPDASGQQATLVVRSLGPHPLEIKNSRLKLLPTEPVSSNQYQTARATYQFDPVRDAVEEPEPAVVLSIREAAAVNGAWIWSSELRSQYATDGTGYHVATYRVQNAGCGHVRLTLPPGVTRQDLHGIWVDDTRAALGPSSDENPDVVVVDLPPGEKLSTVAVHFTTQDDRLSALGHLRPPMPDASLAVLAQHWTVWLPPGYEACEFLPDRQASPARRLSWSQRLFGCLGRAAAQTAFNPLSVGDWSSGLQFFLREKETGGEPAGGRSPSGGAAEGLASTIAPVGPPGDRFEDVPGWTAYRLELSDLPPSGLAVFHGPMIRMVGWLVFLVTVALGLWKLGRRPVLLTALAGVLGTLAMMIPASCAAMASTAMLGTLFCLGAGLLRRRREPSAVTPAGEEPEMDSTITGVFPFGAPVLLAVVLLAGDPVEAAETPQSPTYQVFVPVDEQQQPTGRRVYVPEPLYDQLYRRAAIRAEKPQGWLIAGATYRASLAKEPASQRSVIDQLSADFDLRMFGAAARVRIPFRHDEVQLLPNEALLDGRPVQPEWEADGNALMLEIDEPGQHRLELSLRPTLRTNDGLTGFELAIPRLANSRLEFTAVGAVPAIEFPSAVGSVRWEEQPPRWIADLGPTDQLAVRWQDAAAGGAAPAVDVEQLLWLKILPGSVLVDVKFRLKVISGQLRRLRLLADPGLQLLPLAGPGAPAVQIHASGAQPQTLDFQWPRPISDATMLEARFLWTGVSSVGNIRLPQLDVLDARPVRRWLAVSVDPALEHHLTGPSRFEAVAVPEFTGSWGPADAAPQFACRLSSGLTEWNLSTRPRRPQTTVQQQTLALSLDGQSADVRFDAQLATASGYVFQHRVVAPAALRVQHVSVVAEGAQRVARWTQNRDGAVTIFLTGPVSGAYDLAMRGILPTPHGRNIALSIPQIDDARVHYSLLQFFRRPSAVLEIQKVSGLVAAQDAVNDAGKLDLGRLVQSYRTEGPEAPQAVFMVTPNRPQGRAEQITRIVWEDGGWNAVVDCRLKVTAGVIDEIVVDAPAAWHGPYKLSPTITLKNSEGLAEHRRLLLEPRAAVSGEYAFTISGPLELAPSDRVAVPEVNLREIGPIQRFLVLPKQALDQPITWEAQGLREAQLPGAPAGGQATAYEIIGEPWQVVLQSSEPAVRETPRIRLADIRIAWQTDGGCRGVAIFDVETGKSAQYPLSLPHGTRLLSLAVAGVPGDPVSTGPGTWALPLASDPLPQRVEVLFDNEPSAVGFEAPGEPLSLPWAAHRRFHAPRLGDLPVERTLWTIAGPRWFGLGTPEDAEPAEPPPTAARGEPPAVAEMAAMWQSSLDAAQVVAQYAGDPDSLALRYVPEEADPLPGRLAAIAVFGSLAGLAVVLLRRGTLRERFARWPYAFGTALGLAWWLWLWPSIAGLAIVVIILARQFVPWPAGRGRLDSRHV